MSVSEFAQPLRRRGCRVAFHGGVDQALLYRWVHGARGRLPNEDWAGLGVEPLVGVVQRSTRNFTAGASADLRRRAGCPGRRGRQLVTLEDAGNYITKLHEAAQGRVRSA
jgi:hypothetical protein